LRQPGGVAVNIRNDADVHASDPIKPGQSFSLTRNGAPRSET
jgi:hypothetical protein